MNNKIIKSLIVGALIAGGTLGLVTPAEAWWCRGGGCYHHGGYYHPYRYGYGYHRCAWIPGHYGPRGYWHPGHRVC